MEFWEYLGHVYDMQLNFHNVGIFSFIWHDLGFMQTPNCRRHQTSCLLNQPLEMEARTSYMQASNDTKNMNSMFTIIGNHSPWYQLSSLQPLAHVALCLFSLYSHYNNLFSPTQDHNALEPLSIHHSFLEIIVLHKLGLRPFTHNHCLSLGVYFFWLGTLNLSQQIMPT